MEVVGSMFTMPVFIWLTMYRDGDPFGLGQPLVLKIWMVPSWTWHMVQEMFVGRWDTHSLSLGSEEQVLILYRNWSVSAFSLCHNMDLVIPQLPNYWKLLIIQEPSYIKDLVTVLTVPSPDITWLPLKTINHWISFTFKGSVDASCSESTKVWHTIDGKWCHETLHRKNAEH